MKEGGRERHDADEFAAKILRKGGVWGKNTTMQGTVRAAVLYYSTISSGQRSEKRGFCCDRLGLELPLCLHFY